MGGAAHFGRRVVDCHSQPDALHDGEVGQVVAKKGNFRFFGAGLAENVFISRDLVALFFVNKLDVQLFAASAKGGAAAAGDDASAQSSGDGESETLAVVGVERLTLQCVAIRLR